MCRTLLTLLASAVLGALLGACGGDAQPPAPKEIDGQTRAAWETALAGKVPAEQALALVALAKFEDPPWELFAARMEDPDAEVRAAAIRAIGAQGPEAVKWAPDLAGYLEEDPEGFDPQACRRIRHAAMFTLGKIGPAAFPSMAHLLASRDALQRARVAFTIRPFIADLADGTKVLLPLIDDKSWHVRREAVLGLAVAGKGDERAMEALMKALQDENAEVVRHAAIAIGGIGGRSDREGQALADLLFAHQTGVRAAAAYGLGLMGEEASPYSDRLLDLLKNDSKRVVRIQAARAHWHISGDAEAVLDELQKDIQCDDPGLCRDALRALADLGPEAEPTMPLLIDMLEDPKLQRMAVVVLGAIGPPAKTAVPHLESIAREAAESRPALAEEVAKALASIAEGS